MTRIGGFAPGTFAASRDAEQFTRMRSQLADLNRQLATGKRHATLAGYDAGRGAALSARAQARALAGFEQASLRGEQRLALMTKSLERFGDIAREARSEALKATPPATPAAIGTVVLAARGRLSEALGLLNADFDGQYLFSGSETGTAPVIGMERLLEGDGARAGLKTLVQERRLADIGDGRGRLATAVAGAVVSVAEEAAGLPFGFKLAAGRSASPAIAVAGPAGAPAGVSFTLSAQPSDGETVSLDLALPDGTRETIVLTARAGAASAASATTFAVGADSAATAANLRSALDLALGHAAARQLAASSAIVAATDLMDANAANPARRVAGPPFASATAYAAPGARLSVVWYAGDASPGDARSSQLATVDHGVTLGVGARADEAALRAGLVRFAAVAAESAGPGDAAAAERLAALQARTIEGLTSSGGQRVEDIGADLALAASSMGAARERHQLRQAFLNGVVEGIETPSVEELSAAILSLQTRLQASYQTTASISRLSLADYLR